MFGMITVLMQAAGADPESTQLLVDALLKITGISLVQHAAFAAVIVMITGEIQKRFLASKGWSKYTPIVAIALGIAYFFTPLAGLEPETAEAAISPVTRIFYGAVFGWAVIGGRSFIKNIKGDYDKKEEEDE